jgi:hypothetical protein
MAVTINGTTGISTPGMSSTGDVTLAGSGVEVLNNSGRIVVGQSGSVIQVVSTEYTTVATMSTTGGFTNFSAISGHTVSITPTSTSSKIFIFYMSPLVINNESNNAIFLQLLRGATVVGAGSGGTPNVSAAFPSTFTAEYYTSGAMGHSTLFYLDSPATTSSTTYSIQVASRLSTTLYINSATNTNYRGMTRMYAVEIAG